MPWSNKISTFPITKIIRSAMRSNTKKEKGNTNECPNVKNLIKKVLMRKKKTINVLTVHKSPSCLFW